MLELMPERLRAGEFSNHGISVCGKSFVADMSGALYWPSRDAIIVANLVVATRGTDLKTKTVSAANEVLARLASVIDRFDASSVIVLGNGVCRSRLDGSYDSDGTDAIEISEDTRKTLSIIQAHCKWTWVSADTSRCTQMRKLGGDVVEVLKAEGLTFRELPASGIATHEIAGGMLPAATVSRHGYVIKRPCFVGNGLRLVMPAFGAIAGGNNVLRSDFEALFGTSRLDVLMLGHEGLCPVAPRLLMD